MPEHDPSFRIFVAAMFGVAVLLVFLRVCV